jgi:TrkA domain protein
MLHLDVEDTRTLAELLGAAQLTEGLGAVQQQVEGLVIEWIGLGARSEAIGATIGDGMYRTRTGSSIVAVLRSDTSIPAPGPEFVFEPGDLVVAVGTTDGLMALRALLAP